MSLLVYSFLTDVKHSVFPVSALMLEISAYFAVYLVPHFFFCIFVFFIGVLLFEVVLRCSAEVQSTAPGHKKAVMCLRGKNTSAS